MQIGTQEHYNMIAGFEAFMAKSPIRCRFDKEQRDYWKKGQIYQDGATNDLFKLYCAGYSQARCHYING